MKRLLSLLAGVVLCTSAFSQVPAPVQMIPADGTPNINKELSRKVGGKAFAKKTAALPAFAREEAYELTVTPKGYKVQANTETGYFYALQTLKQMQTCGTVYDSIRS
jgi:hypothetical protein